MNRKIKQKLYKFVIHDGIEVVICVFCTIGIILLCNRGHINFFEEIDLNIFITIVCTFSISILSKFISKKFKNLLEDETKLDSNYQKLIKRYTSELVTYENLSATKDNMKVLQKKLKTKDSKFKFPVENVAIFHNVALHINDSSSDMYQPPEYIKNHMTELLLVHDTSNIYNQLNIRVKDWNLAENCFSIYTMRTTYMDSLLTNRAMDFKLTTGVSNRDLYQYGPFLEELRDSKLSNHLGFNGFIISSDGYIPFIKRNNIVSIGKNTYGDSIGASLKTKYALNENTKQLTEDGLIKAFVKEIKDEIKIDECDMEKFSIKDNLIGAYRDLVEGGKPQFLICMRALIDKDTIQYNFYNSIKNKKNKFKRELKWDNELKELEDGERIIWIHESELKSLAISPSVVVYKGKVLKMMPSASASIVMLIEWLGRKSNESYRMEFKE